MASCSADAWCSIPSIPGASGGAECAHRQLSSNPRATCTFSSRCRPQAQPNQCANKSPQCRGLWDGARHCWREGMGVGSMRCPSSRCSAPADLPHSRSLPASCSILPGALPAPAQPHGSALEGAHSYLAPLAWPGTPLWQQQAAGWTCSRAARPAVPTAAAPPPPSPAAGSQVHGPACSRVARPAGTRTLAQPARRLLWSSSQQPWQPQRSAPRRCCSMR